MILPVRFTVRLPDGSEHMIHVLHMQPDGTVTRIDTHGIDGDALAHGWYTIEGPELDLCTLVTYSPLSDFDK